MEVISSPLCMKISWRTLNRERVSLLLQITHKSRSVLTYWYLHTARVCYVFLKIFLSFVLITWFSSSMSNKGWRSVCNLFLPSLLQWLISSGVNFCGVLIIFASILVKRILWSIFNKGWWSHSRLILCACLSIINEKLKHLRLE